MLEKGGGKGEKKVKGVRGGRGGREKIHLFWEKKVTNIEIPRKSMSLFKKLKKSYIAIFIILSF